MALTFDQFLRLPKSIKYFLFDLTGWNGASSTTFRVSNLAKILNGYYYEPRVKGIPSFSRVMQLWKFVPSQTSFGNLLIANGDGQFDSMHNWIMEGRNFSCIVGGGISGNELVDGDYTLVLKGIMEKPEYSDNQIIIPIRDYSERLKKNLPNSFYTTAADMPQETIGSPIPLCFGTVKNIKPVLIDDFTMTYQVHEGRINDVPAVYDDGSIFTSYTKDLTNGKFTLTAAPVGGLDRVTCDVQGYHNGAKFLTKPGEILSRIATTYTDLVAGDLDAASFTQLDVGRPYDVGVYIRDQRTVFSVFDDMLMGILADWGFTRAGKLQVLAFELPGAYTEQYDDYEMIKFRELKNILPAVYHRFSIRYKQDWSDDGKTLQEVREDPTILVNYADAEEKEINTYLVNQADAQAVGDKFLLIFDGTHYVLEFTIKIRAFVHNLMETIRISRSRYSMANKDFRIIGINENYTNNKITLTCFGG